MGKNFYDQAIDSNMTRNEKTRKVTTVQRKD